LSVVRGVHARAGGRLLTADRLDTVGWPCRR
jgi:hypothetical protein